MNIYRNLDELPDFRNSVLTIGSFDGVHQGHRHIIERMQEFAQALGGETVLITFYPHPRIALAAQQGQATEMKLLTTLEEKADLLADCGVDNLVVVPFTPAFSAQSPDEYIQDFLVRRFHPKAIIIGYDHRFGQGRAGDIEYLKKFEAQYGYSVYEISKQEVDDIAISSTKIRNALTLGEVALAAKLLGHPYRLQGKVVGGQKIGRELGFPTANIEVAASFKLIPLDGIYAVLAHHNHQQYKGMLYIGNRPTVDAGLEKTIEVHIFDFEASIYEEQLQIDFIAFLREDAKFDSLDALKLQLEKDQEAALVSLANA